MLRRWREASTWKIKEIMATTVITSTYLLLEATFLKYLRDRLGYLSNYFSIIKSSSNKDLARFPTSFSRIVSGEGIEIRAKNKHGSGGRTARVFYYLKCARESERTACSFLEKRVARIPAFKTALRDSRRLTGRGKDFRKRGRPRFSPGKISNFNTRSNRTASSSSSWLFWRYSNLSLPPSCIIEIYNSRGLEEPASRWINENSYPRKIEIESFDDGVNFWQNWQRFFKKGRHDFALPESLLGIFRERARALHTEAERNSKDLLGARYTEGRIIDRNTVFIRKPGSVGSDRGRTNANYVGRLKRRLFSSPPFMDGVGILSPRSFNNTDNIESILHRGHNAIRMWVTRTPNNVSRGIWNKRLFFSSSSLFLDGEMIYRYLRLCNYTRGIFKKKYYLNVSIDLINRTEDRREREGKK